MTLLERLWALELSACEAVQSRQYVVGDLTLCSLPARLIKTIGHMTVHAVPGQALLSGVILEKLLVCTLASEPPVWGSTFVEAGC